MNLPSTLTAFAALSPAHLVAIVVIACLAFAAFAIRTVTRIVQSTKGGRP